MENAVRIGEQTGLRLINSGAHRGGKGQYRDGSQIFARRLCSATGYGGVLFRSAGAEAKAQALTLARTYGMKKYGPQRCRILVLTNRDFDLWLANAEGVFRVAPQAPEELAKKHAIDKMFVPDISEEERRKRLRGWHKAVRCAYNWARDDDEDE